MPRPNKATQQKRMRERALKEKQNNKQAERERRREAKRETAGVERTGEDPDIAGIVPGPQPPLLD